MSTKRAMKHLLRCPAMGGRGACICPWRMTTNRREAITKREKKATIGEKYAMRSACVPFSGEKPTLHEFRTMDEFQSLRVSAREHDAAIRRAFRDGMDAGYYGRDTAKSLAAKYGVKL